MPLAVSENDPVEGYEDPPEARDGESGSLTVLANRLPVHRDEQGEWSISPGGLVSALMPVLRSGGGTWIGWGGAASGGARTHHIDDINLVEIPIDSDEHEMYYTRIANGVLWPVFHDRLRQPEFSHEAWDGYRRVNERFARQAAETSPDSGVVWVQDYHLLLVPGMLRALRPDLRIGIFLHTPVPPAALFAELPWRDEIIASLRHADLIGTQTQNDRANLVHTLAGPLSDCAADLADERRVRAFPISIDSATRHQAAIRAEKSGAVGKLRAELSPDRTVFLGVDRLDYTKGLDRRLKALEHAFQTRALDPERVRFVQIAVPSRRQVDDYKEIGAEVDMLVGRINGTYSGVNDPVIHYHRHSLSPDDLAAWYRVADVMVITPLRDGMNLVAKEYVASRFDATGELILSEFAGAARELADATLVNPNDIEAMAAAYVAAHARRDRSTQRPEMRRMHDQVMGADVFRWSDMFLRAMPPARRPARGGR